MNSLSSIPLSERPARVRSFFDRCNIDGMIITRGDNYLGEYVAPHSERLAWVSGFTGSAGLAILLRDKACVFSDGRYTVQMDEQVDHSIWDCRHIIHCSPFHWLEQYAQEKRIGYDPHLVSEHELSSWQLANVILVPVEVNPVDEAWTDQPEVPSRSVDSHPLSYAGESCHSKRIRLARELRENKQDAMVIADCTSLAWLLNIRGHDIDMTPIVHGYGLLHSDGHVDFFVDKDRLALSLEEGVSVYSPLMLEQRLLQFSDCTIRFDPISTPVWFRFILEHAGAHIVRAPDLCSLPKSIKNIVEQEGSRRAHELDSIALARFLYWIERNGVGKSETELSEKLENFRAQSDDYRGQSFETISAVGPNAAYPHYRAIKGEDSLLEKNSAYLVDSGAQYPFGTTDITRTIWIGPNTPPKELKQAFTRVLKGNIALSCQRFPSGIPGHCLDALARSSLWNVGLDYDHGTGHGIGSYLSVHEGPQSISIYPRSIGLQEGMIVSNEPGYYKNGEYGIRIENLLLIKKSDIQSSRGIFLEFDVLTYTPIDLTLVDISLLSQEEISWLNHYHKKVGDRLLSLLDDDFHSWVKEKCSPL